MAANMNDSWWATTSYWMQTFDYDDRNYTGSAGLIRAADIEKRKLMEYYTRMDSSPYNVWCYQSANTLWIRSVEQDREIQALQDKLKEKEVKKDTDLKSLIAYYYNR